MACTTTATCGPSAKSRNEPEMLPARDLSRANGLIEMSTLVAIIAGTAIGGSLFAMWKDATWKIGLLLTAALIGAVIIAMREKEGR